MKMLKLTMVFALLLAAAGMGSQAIASPNDQYAYVMVTGSLLPQKVKIHPIGTNTASPLRVYNRDEIDKMGRFTTEDVLAQDPSLRVMRGMPGGGR
jgi:hypothetical protein